MTQPLPHASATSPQVLIVGAGPAGLSMACALADVGIRSTVLEQAARAQIEQPAEDGREIALTHRGMAVLQALGAWQELPPSQCSPLRSARVFNGHGPHSLDFHANTGDASSQMLGQLVPNHWLRRVAWLGAQRRSDHITLHCEARVQSLSLGAEAASVQLANGETLSAPLMIAADSRFSSTRRMAGIGAEMRDFGRSVILCRMQHELDHEAAALECFHHGHTMAWLPLNGRISSLVLTLSSDEAQQTLAWDEARFLAWVQAHSQGRLGRLQMCGPRHHYPLVATYAHRFAAHRFALIGDAAVGMHPVTAHGYNFGLYGVESLTQLLRPLAEQGRDLGDTNTLQRYASSHRRATWPIYQGTNAVVRLFTDERPLAKALRAGVLQAAAQLPPLKQAITAQLTGRGPSLGQSLTRAAPGPLASLLALAPRQPLSGLSMPRSLRQLIHP